MASARYGNAQAIVRYCEPVQFQLSGFWACHRAESPTGSFAKSANDGTMPLICPTCQNVFAGKASMPASPATLHGVVFDILVGSKNRARRGACGHMSIFREPPLKGGVLAGNGLKAADPTQSPSGPAAAPASGGGFDPFGF